MVAPTISTKDLTFAFPDGSSGLEHVTLDLPAGSRNLLIGGKNTNPYRILTPMLNPQSERCWQNNPPPPPERQAHGTSRASRKKVLPALASQARKQVAAEKRACSSKDAVADKPLPDRTFKPQKQASAENTALSPKDAVPEKPLSSQACESQKHAPAEKRAVSPEDTPAKKPRPAQASKVRKQATAGKKAVSPKRASARKPPSRPAFTPRPLSIEEEISQFRLGEGGRVDLPPAEPSVEPYTKEELEVAATLQSMKTQEQVPDHSTSPRHDSFAAGSTFGRLQMPDRRISSTERLLEYYVGDRA